MFLTAALAMSMMPLTSCSKDEPTPADKAKENVTGTRWTSYDKRFGISELTFDADGTFLWDFDGGFSKGTYKQDGVNIRFNVKSSFFMPYNYTEGTISYGGMSMEIPLYYHDGDYGYTAKFTLDINSVK